MNIKVEPINKAQKFELKVAAIAASALIPAAYMTHLHVDMFRKEDKQNRSKMFNKMLGFFAGISLSALLVHKRLRIGNRVFWDSKGSAFTQAVKIALAAAAPFVGLKTAKLINKKMYSEK